MIIVDTDILIDAGRAVPEAVIGLASLERQETLSVSVITRMELIVGCENKTELSALNRFLTRFTLLPLSEAISERATGLLQQYRLSHGLLIPDALIVATALVLDSAFITKNQRHYRFLPDLNLIPYPLPAP